SLKPVWYLSLRPGKGPLRPHIERFRRIAALLLFGCALQARIDERGREIWNLRKLNLVSENRANFVAPQHLDKLLLAETVMPDFYGVADFAAFDTLWKQLEKSFEIAGIVTLRRQELPIDGSELLFEIHDTACEKARYRSFCLGKDFPGCRKSRTLER